MSKAMSALDKTFYDSIQRLGVTLDQYNWESPVHYGAWLRQTVGLVKHTTRFVCLAAGRTSLDDRAAHYMWIDHLKGELNHDLVALRDLKALDSDESRVPLFQPTQEIIDAQYRCIESGDPVALNGYALLLEGLACIVAPRILDRLTTVYKKNQISFLSLHAKVDQDHYPDGLAYLKSISSPAAALVIKNLEQTEAQYGAMLKAATQWANSKGASRRLSA